MSDALFYDPAVLRAMRDACEAALNRAARLDPESDRAAGVKELRAAIAAGRLGSDP